MKDKLVVLIAFGLIRIATAQTDSLDIKENKDSLSTGFNIPIFSTSGGDIDTDLEQQDASSLLMSSRDVFAQFASFQFGSGRYRLRGYTAENQMVMINGVNVNNLETGFSSWSSWGGLNDVTRFVENRVGIIPNRMGFSGVGGYTNIDSKASSFKKGTRVSYANANRIFGHRVMLTHSTGMLEKGWAITLSASNRYGDQVNIPGTYFNASSFYVAIDKHISDKHLLTFTGFGAPMEQGRNAAETKEAYELAGSNYYNSLWGYQNGKVRNASVSKVTRPMLLLSHVFRINTKQQLTTTVFYNFGKSSLSSLSWNNAPDPRPDYYRYLPGYYYLQGDTLQGDIIRNNRINDPASTQQINWDKLIAMNQANFYSLPGNSGQGINTTETRARYILEKQVQDLSNLGLNMVYNHRHNNLFFTAGLNANKQRTRKYKEVEDLLGASYWLDVDNFAENLGVDDNYKQNDIEHVNRKVKEGEKFGYDYSININRAEIWTQAEYSFNRFDIYGAVQLSNTQIWREGYVANGKFTNTSKGLSEKLNFLNYGVKGGIVCKLNGRNFITVNGNYLTRAPEANNVFISPRVRNDIVNGTQDEKVISGDINYLTKFPTFKFRATYYNTQIRNQTWLRTFWSDEYNNNVDYIMTNVNEAHQGVEIGIEKVLLAAHTLQGALGYGQFIYTNRPVAQAWQDNNNQSLFTGRTVYLNNYKIGNGPQLVCGLGYRYTGAKFWFAGITINRFDEIYIDPNPDRRTAEAISKYAEGDSQYKEIIEQEKLPAYYTVNLNAGKSFRVKKKYLLNFNLSINNLLNNHSVIISGYEQLRWDQSNVNKFPNKYYYMTGATYMAVVNFNF